MTSPSPTPARPLDQAGARTQVDAALTRFMAEQHALLSSISPDLVAAADALRDFLLDGGKRLRPAFCYWGWRGAGGEDGTDPAGAGSTGIANAAAALELLQASALVHDDLMDRSDTRRGLPSMHRRFEALHREQGWRGDREQYGAAAALLLGDLLLIWCDQLFVRCGLDAAAVLAAKPVFDLMRTEVMAGQYLDVLEPVAGDSTDDLALTRATTVLHFKSAKYTIERPLQVGARLAGASEELVAAYGDFGLPLGEAFQLRDDLLGVFGDPAVTGKPAGDDLREGKRTLLVALALRALPRAEAARLDGRLGAADLTAAEIAELSALVAASGAPAQVEQRIEALMERSLAALAAAPLKDEAARETLLALARAATVRRY
ncbi:polyprenyl synthetase family protein [Kitasatospora sp. NBC_01250]|uniref:polyprenyl synthetase family protein n=1 Tax=unclassified Kitasatospora TaxID=2633591 RepID=UPI002E13D818|nr:MULTISPECIES: polyprenyl synthetase family protein [unclassified Kitasatospora]WSJ69903.1 polyprenyl synthetase family protein [Kitasatospora sp. NBC_01302]